MLSSSRIEELRTKFDDNPRRYFAPLANEYRKAGRIDDAIALCREQLDRYPDHMSGHIVLGQSLFESRALDEAGRVFEQAVALDGENLIALRHLGDIARERGELDTARGWYGRVLDADPHHEDVAAQLAALGAGPSGGQRVDEGVPDIEVPSFAGALASAVDAPPASAPSAPSSAGADDRTADGPPAWEPPDLDDLINRSDDVIVLDAPATDEAIVLSPSLLDQAALLDGAPEPVDGLEFDPVVGLDEPPAPVERAPLVGFDPTPSAAALPPLDLHFDDFSAESLRSTEDAEPAADGGGASQRWDDGTADLQLPAIDDDDQTDITPEPVDAGRDDVGLAFEEVALGAPVASETEAPPELVDERKDDADADVEASAPPAPAFVTETMAELYLQQGYAQQALDVYRRLAELRPSDDAVAVRVAAIEAQLASGAAAAHADAGSPDAGVMAPDDDEPQRDESAMMPPAAVADPVDAGFDLIGDAPDRVADGSEPGGGSPAAAREGVAEEAPLSARAFFASLAERRPTPALDAPAVAEGASAASEAAIGDAQAQTADAPPHVDAVAADGASAPSGDVVDASEATGVPLDRDRDAAGIASLDASLVEEEAAVVAHDQSVRTEPADTRVRDGVLEAACVDGAVELTAVAHVAELPTSDARPTLESLFADGTPTSADAHAAERLASAFGPGDERAPALMADAERAAALRAVAEASAAPSALPGPRVPAAPAPAQPPEARTATPAAPAAYSFDKFFADVPAEAPPPSAAGAAAAAAPAAPPVTPAPAVWPEPVESGTPPVDGPSQAPEPASRPQAPAAPVVPAASGDDDIEQFNEWLRGLRDS